MTASRHTLPGGLDLTDAQTAERGVQLALWASGESVWEWDATTNRVTVDRGETDEPALPGFVNGLTLEAFFDRAHAADAAAIRMAWRLHLRGAHPDIDVCFRINDETGHQRWLRVRGRALVRDRRGRAERVLSTLKDVTAQRKAEESLQLMAHAFCSTRDAMAVVDPQWNVLELNGALVRLAGDDSGIMPGSDLRHWLAVDEGALAPVLADGIWRDERALTGGTGPVPVAVSITAVVASDGGRHCFLVALHDLRERRQAEQRLQRMALVDQVTGLPNRLAAQLRLEAALLLPSPQFGVLFIDLDGFKEINDSYGHDQGDATLTAVGVRLRKVLPEDALLARFGSSEFIVVLASGSGDTEVRASAQIVLAALAGRFDAGDHEVRLKPTIGAVLAPQHGLDINRLLRRADAATHAGKAREVECCTAWTSSRRCCTGCANRASRWRWATSAPATRRSAACAICRSTRSRSTAAS